MQECTHVFPRRLGGAFCSGTPEPKRYATTTTISSSRTSGDVQQKRIRRGVCVIVQYDVWPYFSTNGHSNYYSLYFFLCILTIVATSFMQLVCSYVTNLHFQLSLLPPGRPFFMLPLNGLCVMMFPGDSIPGLRRQLIRAAESKLCSAAPPFFEVRQPR